MELKATFTGICAFVENNDAAAVRCKAVALMPDGNSKKKVVRPALDELELRRHRAYLKFKACNLKQLKSSGLSPELEIIRYLDKVRVTFLPQGAITELATCLKWVADLGSVAPKYAEVDLDFLKPAPSGIAAQILFHVGLLSAPLPPQGWVFPNNLSGDVVYSDNLSHEVVLNIPSLTSIGIKIESFDGLSTEVIELLGDPKEVVEICFANLCDENPLRWETESSAKVDDDFRWYYELTSNRDNLRNSLMSLPLPVPNPKKASPDGQGMNCLIGKMPKALFNLDAFLP